jgi:hypothetical protein
MCIDVGDGYEVCGDIALHVRAGPLSGLPEIKLTENDLDDKLLSILELDEFYSMLAHNSIRLPDSSWSTPGIIVLPSICNFHGGPTQANEFCAIPIAKHLTPDDFFIRSWDGYGLTLKILPDGWTRCACGCLASSFSNNYCVGLIFQSALPQAQHIGCQAT